MKIIKYLLAMIFLLNFTSISFAEKPVIIASGESGSGWSEYSKHYGYMIHMTTEVFKLAGIQTEIKFYPWKRAYDQALRNKVDCSCCWFFVDERAKDFYYSEPVFEETMVFFHLKSFKFDWNTIDDLRNVKLGGNSGFNYGDDFQQAEKKGKIQIDRVPNNILNLKKLLKGRIQIFPIAVITGYETLRQIFPLETVELFTYHPKPVLQKTLHLLVPKKMEEKNAKHLLTKFNQGLKLLRETGQHNKIVKDAEMGFYSLMKEKWVPQQND